MPDHYVLPVCIVGSNTELTQQFGRLTAIATFTTDYLPTIGIDSCFTEERKVNNKLVKHWIFILNGDDNFYSIRVNQYRKVPICFFCFNKGKKESFEKINHYYSEYKQAVKKPRIITLVGIQSDDEEITTEEGQQLGNQLNADYYETTLNDKQQVSQIFYELTEKYFRGF